MELNQQSIFRTPTPAERRDFIDLRASKRYSGLHPKAKSWQADLEFYFNQKNRDQLKKAYELNKIRKLKLSCLKHAKKLNLTSGEKDFEELYKQSAFLEYQNSQINYTKFKDAQGREQAVDVITIDFKCPRCLYGNSFSFKTHQLNENIAQQLDSAED